MNFQSKPRGPLATSDDPTGQFSGGYVNLTWTGSLNMMDHGDQAAGRRTIGTNDTTNTTNNRRTKHDPDS